MRPTRTVILGILLLATLYSTAYSEVHRLVTTSDDIGGPKYNITAEVYENGLARMRVITGNSVILNTPVNKLSSWKVISHNDDPAVDIIKLKAPGLSRRDGGVISLKFLQEYNVMSSNDFRTIRFNLRFDTETGKFALFTSGKSMRKFNRIKFKTRKKFGKAAGIKQIALYFNGSHVATYNY